MSVVPKRYFQDLPGTILPKRKSRQRGWSPKRNGEGEQQAPPIVKNAETSTEGKAEVQRPSTRALNTGKGGKGRCER